MCCIDRLKPQGQSGRSKLVNILKSWSYSGIVCFRQKRTCSLDEDGTLPTRFALWVNRSTLEHTSLVSHPDKKRNQRDHSAVAKCALKRDAS